MKMNGLTLDSGVLSSQRERHTILVVSSRMSTVVANHGSALETQRRGTNQVGKVLQRN